MSVLSAFLLLSLVFSASQKVPACRFRYRLFAASLFAALLCTIAALAVPGRMEFDDYLGWRNHPERIATAVAVWGGYALIAALLVLAWWFADRWIIRHAAEKSGNSKAA